MSWDWLGPSLEQMVKINAGPIRIAYRYSDICYVMMPSIKWKFIGLAISWILEQDKKFHKKVCEHYFMRTELKRNKTLQLKSAFQEWINLSKPNRHELERSLMSISGVSNLLNGIERSSIFWNTLNDDSDTFSWMIYLYKCWILIVSTKIDNKISEII